MNRREASRSRLLTAHHAARYLGISGTAFHGWVYRYKIRERVEDGKRGFAREDLDSGLAAFNEAMRRGNPHWVDRPPVGA